MSHIIARLNKNNLSPFSVPIFLCPHFPVLPIFPPHFPAIPSPRGRGAGVRAAPLRLSPLPALDQNRFQHGLDVLIDVRIGEPQNAVTHSLQVLDAPLVIGLLLDVSFAVHFHNDAGRGTTEIGNILPYRELAPELVAFQVPIAEAAP